VSASSRTRRVLAIDPTSRGFGFVILEGETKLLDWGVRQIRANKDEATLMKVQELIRLYRPRMTREHQLRAYLRL
jgi:hypothetical protein